jgi:hypothetical protein
MKYIKYLLGVLILASYMGCNDQKGFSGDYDINFPRAIVDSISPMTDTIGKNIKIYGKQFVKISSVQIAGLYSCAVVSVDTTVPTRNVMVVTIPRQVEKGTIYIKNLYKVQTQSTVSFTPVFPDVTVSEWPTSIELGRTFKIRGKNVDMISKVTVGGATAIIKSIGEDVITVSIEAITTLSIGDNVKIAVTTKSGNNVPASGDIPIVAPSQYYTPFNGYLLFDFESNVTYKDEGSGLTYQAAYDLNNVKGIGHSFAVLSATSSAWNGVYCSLTADNSGKGYDLSNFREPYLTFLVNTNGHEGYFSFDVTQNGTTEDKHIDGGWASKLGYTDNYVIKTTGWEWRSYPLSAFGFSADMSGNIDNFKFLFRGGNGGSPYEIHMDQVMITDGPLNPVAVMDFESGAPVFPNPAGLTGGGSPVYGLNLGTGANIGSGYQGNNYYTVKATDSHSGEYGSVMSSSVSLTNFESNYNALYINFLLNTGSANYGYFQLIIRQGANWVLKHFYGNPNYTDSWSMNTTGQWQWRSIPLNPRNQSWDWDSNNHSGVQIDFSQPFTVEVSFKNASGAAAYETDVDYFYMSNVPMSPTKYAQ